MCTQCQTIAGGFGCGSIVAAKGTVVIEEGELELKSYMVPESAAAVTRRFCGVCGTHVMASNPSHPVTAVSAGTLDDKGYFKPQVAIWCQSLQPHHTLPPSLPQFPQYPPAPASAPEKPTHETA
jgi:hypothetical protein